MPPPPPLAKVAVSSPKLITSQTDKKECSQK